MQNFTYLQINKINYVLPFGPTPVNFEKKNIFLKDTHFKNRLSRFMITMF